MANYRITIEGPAGQDEPTIQVYEVDGAALLLDCGNKWGAVIRNMSATGIAQALDLHESTVNAALLVAIRKMMYSMELGDEDEEEE